MTDLRRALTKVSPLVRGGVGEAIGHGTIRTVDDTGATGVLDTGDGLLIGIHGLREQASGTRLGFMSSRLTEDLEDAYMLVRSRHGQVNKERTLWASESFSWRKCLTTSCT